MTSAAPDAYAVMGNPISHSKSPLIHSLFAQATGQRMSYVAIEGPKGVAGGFAGAVDAFRSAGGLGLNVTVPFKLDAFAYATEASARARQAGAVNAMKFVGARVLAENFDGVGLVRDIQHNLGCALAGRSVLVLGAGGATRGALMPLLQAGAARVVVANRTPERARAVVADIAPGHAGVAGGGFADLAHEGTFDVVLNATSASLFAELPPVPAHVFAPHSLAYELAYGKGLTPFLTLARSAGVTQVADGVGMLVEQAAEAFEWWRGVRPDTRSVIDRLTVALI
jgi:shikimate dehydrogenase